MISIIHIGLPLCPPWLPAEECEKIGVRLATIQARMTAAGYRYRVVHASPEEGLDAFGELLRSSPCEIVLIGGGVASDPKMAKFKQQIVQAVSDAAPQTAVLEFDHSVDVQVLVERWIASHHHSAQRLERPAPPITLR